MVDYSVLTEDQKGRQLHPVLANTAKDGSGTWYIPLVDSSGQFLLSALPTGTNVIGKVGHNITGIGHGYKVVTTAGSDECIVASSTPAKTVIIQAQTDNTTAVAVGATGVDASIATGTGIILYPGDWTPPIDVDNLTDIYVDALSSGEGVRYIYLT